MLGCAEQLEAISRAVSNVEKVETLTSQERYSLPYLKRIRDKPGLSAKHLLTEVKVPRGVSYKMVTNRLAYLRDCGYIESRTGIKNGITLYWTITKSGEKFLAQHTEE